MFVRAREWGYGLEVRRLFGVGVTCGTELASFAALVGSGTDAALDERAASTVIVIVATWGDAALLEAIFWDRGQGLAELVLEQEAQLVSDVPPRFAVRGGGDDERKSGRGRNDIRARNSTPGEQEEEQGHEGGPLNCRPRAGHGRPDCRTGAAARFAQRGVQADGVNTADRERRRRMGRERPGRSNGQEDRDHEGGQRCGVAPVDVGRGDDANGAQQHGQRVGCKQEQAAATGHGTPPRRRRGRNRQPASHAGTGGVRRVGVPNRGQNREKREADDADYQDSTKERRGVAPNWTYYIRIVEVSAGAHHHGGREMEIGLEVWVWRPRMQVEASLGAIGTGPRTLGHVQFSGERHTREVGRTDHRVTLFGILRFCG